jgi:hypothetical protein
VCSSDLKEGWVVFERRERGGVGCGHSGLAGMPLNGRVRASDI